MNETARLLRIGAQPPADYIVAFEHLQRSNDRAPRYARTGRYLLKRFVQRVRVFVHLCENVPNDFHFRVRQFVNGGKYMTDPEFLKVRVGANERCRRDFDPFAAYLVNEHLRGTEKHSPLFLANVNLRS